MKNKTMWLATVVLVAMSACEAESGSVGTTTGSSGGTFPVAPCLNGVSDGDETDVDCGGDGCLKCDDGLRCVNGADCRSGVCDGDVCICTINHVVISEVQTRGPNERQFIELWNGSPAAVVLDSTWYLAAQSATGAEVVVLWQGHDGLVMKPWAHYLITSTTWANGGTPDGDDVLMASVPSGFKMELLTFDGASKATVEGLCAYRTDEELAVLAAPSSGCDGTPVHNPADVSSFALERLPGFNSGHCQDNDHSAADFYWHVATPTNSAAPPTQ